MKQLSLIALSLLALTACTNPEPNSEADNHNPTPVAGEGYTPDYLASWFPTFDYTAKPYNGATASDIAAYPNDADLNPTMTDWQYTVTVTYNGTQATVAIPQGCQASSTISGANVDLALGAEQFINVVATGSSSQGSLRIAGDRKHCLTLANLTLTSTDRPAINDQGSKRVFLILEGSNSLSDNATYTSSTEDRKGCFFSEAHVIIGGQGALTIAGKHQHGFATDGFLYINPGTTLAVTEAPRNGIHVKGSANELNAFRGIEVRGGLVFASVNSPRGKAVKCDQTVNIYSGNITLQATGDADIDPADGTLSSPACIKSDVGVNIIGDKNCQVQLIATGAGAKGIKSDGYVKLAGGIVNIAISGRAVAGSGDSATPKAVKADVDLLLAGGGNYVSSTAPEGIGLEADGSITITGGVNIAYGGSSGFKAPSANATDGILLAGGNSNSPLTSAKTLTLQDVAAGQKSTIGTSTYIWPTNLTNASLLLFSKSIQ